MSIQTPVVRCALCGGEIVNGVCHDCGQTVAGDDDIAETLKMPRFTVPPDPDMTTPRLQSIPLEGDDAGRSETSELIEKSIRGTQWIMVAILIGVPLGFLTNIIMGRISPEALGTYTLMLLVVTTVQTFFLFGGANVIINFIPRATARQKSALLFSYVSIAVVFCIVFYSAMFAFPQALSFILLGRPVNATVYGFLFFFIPIVIMQTLTIAVLQGEMELPAAARTQYGVQTAGFALAIGAYIAVHKGLLPDTGAAVLVVPVAYLVSFASGIVALVRIMRRRWQLSLRWYLPPSFWRFTTTFHFNTVVFFFFVNVNQIFILYAFTGNSVAQIGIFRAAIVVATYALWAPNLFTGAMYPFFTNLVARKDFATLKAAYQRYSAITGMIVALVSLIAGLFAPQILRLFGKTYVDQATPLMVIFALMYLAFASAAYVPSTALITAHEDIWLNLMLNIFAFGARFGLYFPFIFVWHKGLIGIASADAISLGVLYLGTLLAVWLRYRVTVPLRQHLVSIVGVALLLGVYAWQPTGNTWFASHTWQIVERFGALIVFLAIVSRLRLVSRADLARVASRLGPLARVLRLTAPRTAATNAPAAR